MDADTEGIALGRGTQDATARVGEVLHDLGSELYHSPIRIAVREEKPLISIADAHSFPAQLARCQDRTRDDGVEPGDIAPAKIDGNAFYLRLS